MKSKKQKKPYLLVAVNLIIFSIAFTVIRLNNLQLTWSELFLRFWYIWLYFAWCLGLTFEKLNVK
jgi:hypothetical protein